MTRFATLSAVFALSAASGCIVVDPNPPPPDPVYVNYAPEVTWAESGCYWDGYYNDYIWYFQADADDQNGVYDVVSMWADVYDEPSGAWIDSFELYPTDDPYVWFSDWLGGSTYLSCSPNNYVVDFVAYDSMDAEGVLSVYPILY